MNSLLLTLVTLVFAVTCEPGELALPTWHTGYSSGHSLPLPVRDRFKINSEYEDEIDIVPRAYPPQFSRRDAADSNIKADSLFDSLISNMSASTFDRVLKVSWNSTRDNYHSPQYNDIAVFEAQSTLFETADNITRIGYATAAEVQGNTNEIILTGHVRLPIPRITVSVTVWDKEGQMTSMDATAVSARDVVMSVQLILNKHWKKIFVTSVTPKDNMVFRANIKCDGEKSFDFCKQVQDVLSRDVLSSIDRSIRDALKFRLEELELDL